MSSYQDKIKMPDLEYNQVDAELVSALKNNDHDALKRLYDRFYLELYYFALKYLKNKALAEDAVQDVFIIIWDERNRLDASKSIRAFIFTILKNQVLNIIRKYKKEILTAFDNQSSVPTHFHEESSDQKNELKKTDIIMRAVERLPERQKEIFYKKVLDENKNNQVASDLSISENTVKVHYQRSLKTIKAYLQNYLNRRADEDK